MPVVGNIPDMVSDTETYITLKKMYENKGKEDREIINKISRRVLKEINWSNEIKKQQIFNYFDSLDKADPNYLDIICKNHPQISVFKFSTLREETDNQFSAELEIFEDQSRLNFIWYILIKSSSMFYQNYNRYPGEIKNFESDIEPLKQCVNEFITQRNSELNFDINLIKDEFIYEFCRFSNSRIPPIVSIIGSMASQEAIKLITYQFKTIDNTIIYDGIHSTVSTFKF
jgi:hypothetical protein